MRIEVPEGSKNQLTERQIVLLTKELNDRLVTYVKRKNTSVSSLLRNVIRQIVDQEDRDSWTKK